MRLGFRFLYGVVLILITHFVHPTSAYTYHVCTNETTFTPKSSYESSLNRVLSALSKASSTTSNGFYNATSPSPSSNDTAYGLFLCRGDVPSAECATCVPNAAAELPFYCPHDKEAVIWYDDCMLRYSNQYIFSSLEESPLGQLYNYQNATADVTR